MRFGAGGVVPNLYSLFKDFKAFNYIRTRFDIFYSGLEEDTRDGIIGKRTDQR